MGSGGASGVSGSLAPLLGVPLLQTADVRECGDVRGFHAWLVGLSASSINANIDIAPYSGGQQVITSKSGFEDVRLILDGDSGRIQRRNRNIGGSNPDLQWQVDTAFGVRVVFGGTQIINFVDPHYSDFKTWLFGLPAIEVQQLLEYSTATANGASFQIATPRFGARHRLRIANNLAIIEVPAGGTWVPANDVAKVIRDGSGTIVGFEEADNNNAEEIGFVLRGLVSSMLGIPTTTEEWSLAWQEVRGCAAAVSKAASDLIQVLFNPIDSLVTLLKALPALFAAIQYSPTLFLNEVLRGVLKVDDYNAAQTEAQRRELLGQIKCELALSLVGGRALQLLTPTAVGTLAVAASRGDYNRFNNRDGDNGNSGNNTNVPCNSFPTGTPVLMADGTYRAIDQIRSGDLVLAADETTGVWSERVVLDQWSHQDNGQMATVTLADGSQVTATDHHQFWVSNDGAWVDLEDVQTGDSLLTPEGVTEVLGVVLSAPTNTLVWELDVAIDNTFAVHTGTADVLVHNQTRCFEAHAEPAGYSGRPFDELMPDGNVPGTATFDNWWDNLTVDELDYLVLNGGIKDRMVSRIRGTNPNHEWCMCSLMEYFKKNWDISMAEIRAFVTPTADVRGTIPNRIASRDGVRKGTPWAHPTSGFANSPYSREFHDELEELIFTSNTKSDFARNLPALLDDWGVPAGVVPIPNW